jgi:plasmid stabilization system protein ParE
MAKEKKTTHPPFKVKVTTHALQHIDEITGYIAFIHQQPHNAIKVGDAIFATIDKISVNPFAYRECSEIPTV